MKELCYRTVAQLANLIRQRKVSPVEVAHAFLERASELEPRLNSFITLLPDQALEAARRAEREIQAGHYRGLFHGIPVGLKDVFHTQGVRTTSGSAIYREYVPAIDCTAAQRLKAAGSYIIGKLNTSEFAHDPTGSNPHYGPARNPWDVGRMTGGSSSGSASAVASGQCPLTLGSDSGGSIRIPASLCGVVGYKPTYGLVSRYGITSGPWTLDHAGPLARTVEDVALAMNVLAGHDTLDPTSARVPIPDYTEALTSGVRGLRLGVPREYVWDVMDPDVRGAVQKAIGQMERLGAVVEEVSMPLLRAASFALLTLLSVDQASYHRELLLKRGAEYDPQVRLWIEVGLFVPSASYIKAMRARTLICREFHNVFQQVDLLVMPTTPIPAPTLGQKEVQLGTGMRGVVNVIGRLTRPFNLTGSPAITVPCGLTSQGMPVGLQIAGPRFKDALVLQTAHAYQQATEWHMRRPSPEMEPGPRSC